MRHRWALVLLSGALLLGVAGACASFESANDEPAAPDAATDTLPAAEDAPATEGPRCDPTKPFGAAVALPTPSINTPGTEDSPSLTADELTLVFQRDGNLYRSVRSTRSEPFPEATKMGVSAGAEGQVWLSGDGLELLFSSGRSFAPRIYRATRTSLLADFETPQQVVLPVPYDVLMPSVGPAAQGRELLFVARRDGDAGNPYVIYRVPFLVDAGRDAVAPLELVDAATTSEEYTTLSSDGLTLFFGVRASNTADRDIAVATRPSLAAPFGSAATVAELSTPGHSDQPGWVSPDGCRMYFASSRSGSATTDLYVADRGK